MRTALIFLFGTFSIIFVLSCQRSVTGDSVKLQLYYAKGERLYEARCSNCHQKSGKGLGLLYPPLEPSDYLTNNFEEVICLIKYGKKGNLMVNGKDFNQPMPGIPTLTDLEIAEVATYLYNAWGRERGIVETNGVTRILEACSKR
jgi:cytochrome c551